MDPYAATLSACDLPAWYALWAWQEAVKTYNGLPGPHWLRIALVVICLAIPGPQDEILLLAIVALTRAIKSTRNRRRAQ